MAIYFGSPFGRYPMFHTLASVGRIKLFSMLKECSRFFELKHGNAFLVLAWCDHCYGDRYQQYGPKESLGI